jgi:hypothetical protein
MVGRSAAAQVLPTIALLSQLALRRYNFVMAAGIIGDPVEGIGIGCRRIVPACFASICVKCRFTNALSKKR